MVGINLKPGHYLKIGQQLSQDCSLALGTPLAQVCWHLHSSDTAAAIGWIYIKDSESAQILDPESESAFW